MPTRSAAQSAGWLPATQRWPPSWGSCPVLRARRIAQEPPMPLRQPAAGPVGPRPVSLPCQPAPRLHWPLPGSDCPLSSSGPAVQSWIPKPRLRWIAHPLPSSRFGRIAAARPHRLSYVYAHLAAWHHRAKRSLAGEVGLPRCGKTGPVELKQSR